MVQGSLLAFDSQRYRLLAWVVMPNRVHVLFQPINGWTVAKIVASWKKFTARKICDDRQKGGEELGIPSGTASIGTAISATKHTWCKSWSTFISIR